MSKTSSPMGQPSPQAITRKAFPANLPTGGLLQLYRENPQPATAMHDHSFDELAYIRRGSATHFTEQGESRLQSGDVIIIRPMTWHAYQNVNNLWVDNLIFDAHFLTHLFPLIDRQSSWFELFRGRAVAKQTGPQIIRLKPEEQKPIYWALDCIAQEQSATPTGWESCTSAAALLAITHTARAMAGKIPPPTIPMSLRTEQAILAISRQLLQDPTQHVSIPRLAKSVSLSPHYLSHCFVQRMGMGIVEYAHRLRIDLACQLLRSTDWPIARIAQESGYDEIAYFSRRFKQQVGHPPSIYRRQFHNETLITP